MNGLVLSAPVRYWACPSCNVEDRTQQAAPHTRMHSCAGLRGLTAPMVEVRRPGDKPDAQHRVLERDDYAPDAERIMAVDTQHGDGSNDRTVFPMSARMAIRSQ